MAGATAAIQLSRQIISKIGKAIANLRKVEDSTDAIRKFEDINEIIEEVATHYDSKGNLSVAYADRNAVLRTALDTAIEGPTTGAFSTAVVTSC